MLLSSFAVIITKQLTLSVTWPFDSSPALYYKWSIVTMRLSCTVMEIWSLKCWRDGRTHGRTDAQMILYSVECYALHWTDNNQQRSFVNDNLLFTNIGSTTKKKEK